MKRLLVISIACCLSACASAPKDPVIEPVKMPTIKRQPVQITGSIYQHGRDVRLFEDRTASRVGDLITVMFEESTSASKSAETTTSKNSDTSLTAPTAFGQNLQLFNQFPLSASIGGSRSSSGSGDSDQSNTFSGQLTAMVVDVHPNGNLVIQGKKKLTLNRGDEYITISGIIRPQDISTSNAVSSLRVANASIMYTGKGEIADANTMGWLTRFFNSPIWPF